MINWTKIIEDNKDKLFEKANSIIANDALFNSGVSFAICLFEDGTITVDKKYDWDNSTVIYHKPNICISIIECSGTMDEMIDNEEHSYDNILSYFSEKELELFYAARDEDGELYSVDKLIEYAEKNCPDSFESYKDALVDYNKEHLHECFEEDFRKVLDCPEDHECSWRED